MKVIVTENEIQRSAELLALAQEMEEVAKLGTHQLELSVKAANSHAVKSVARGKAVYSDYRDPKAAECAVADLARATAIKFCQEAAAIYRKHMPIPVEVQSDK